MTTPLLFWDVDTQVDFMHPNGRLYVQGAEALIENLGRLTRMARRYGVPIVASADDHEMEDAEISDDPDWRATYPPHCMRGTPGAERIPETEHAEAVTFGHQALDEEEIASKLATPPRVARILKKEVDVFSNPNTEKIVELLDPERIVVYGVALDVCNRYAVEGLLERRGEGVAVVTDAVQPIDPAAGEALLADWRDRGVELVTTDEVLAAFED